MSAPRRHPRSLVGVALLMAAACRVDEILVGSVPEDAADAGDAGAPSRGGASSSDTRPEAAPDARAPEGGGACRTNDDCADSELCEKPTCAAETGTCAATPTSCDFSFVPSCGCDATTYQNDCVRRRQRVAAGTAGPCLTPARPCVPGSCAASERCVVLVRTADVTDTSTCDQPRRGQCLVLDERCNGATSPRFQSCAAARTDRGCVDPCLALSAEGRQLIFDGRCPPP